MRLFPTVVLVMLVLTTACAGPSDESADTADVAGTGTADTAAAPGTCLSQLSPEERRKTLESWIGGAMPTEVQGTEDCHFYDFAWRAFLALAAEESGAPVFTGLGSSEALFPPTGEMPAPYPGHETPGVISARQLNKHASSGHFGDDAVGIAGFEADSVAQAASLVPLVDQRGRWVHYSILTNRTEYDHIAELGLYATDCYDSWGGSTTGEVIYATPDPQTSPPTTGEVTVTCGIVAADGTRSTKTYTCAENVADDPLPRLLTGSVELKLAWRVLETCDLPDSPPPGECAKDDGTYLTVTGNVAPYSPTVPSLDGVTLGLVGIHILAKTPDHPDWVWTTFERRENDPDCPGVTGDWTFYDGVEGRDNMFCTPCPVALDSWTGKYAQFAQTARDQQAKGTAILTADGKSLACTEDPGAFNLAQPPLYRPGTGPGECPKDPIPTQVCREIPIPEPVASLNEQVETVLQGLDPTLAVYELVGVAWLKTDCGSSPTCVEAGTRQLTNSTMETFEQGLVAGTRTGCLVCHGPNQFNPKPYAFKPYAAGLADRSFMFMNILQRQGGACTAPRPSYQCPECPVQKQARFPAPDPRSPLAAGGGG